MKQTYQRYSIGKDTAIALYDSGWWKDQLPKDIALFQLFTDELAMPFNDFQGAIEAVVKHPVFTHQFVTCYDLLAKEVLDGVDQPTEQELKAYAAQILAGQVVS